MNSLRRLQIWMEHGSRLLGLRLKLLRLDLMDQLQSTMRLSIAAMAAVVSLGLALMAALFALDTYLADSQLLVFSLLAIFFVLLAAALILWGWRSWQIHKNALSTTMQRLEEDIACLNGVMTALDQEDDDAANQCQIQKSHHE